MAVRTRDGSVRPEWHAEPVAAAMAGVRVSRVSPSLPGEADVQRVRQPISGVSIEREVRDGGLKRRMQAVAELLHSCVVAVAQSRTG
jgi:hypothetical protein